MISTTSAATTRTKTTPPTVMAALPRYLSIRGSPDRETRRDSRHGLTRRPRRRALHDVLDPPTVGLSRQALEQPLQARRDGGARPVEVLADRGHVVPALHGHPRKGEVTEVARDRHDAGGLRHALRRHPPRSEPPQVDALLEKPRDDDRRDLGAGLGPGERGARPDAARAGEALELRGGDDALRRPVQAHEEDGRRAHFTKTHVGRRSGNAINPMSAVAAISAGLLTFQRNRTPRLPSPRSAVSQSPIAIRPSSTLAPRIVPMAAAYAPFTKPWTLGFARCRTSTGATIRTRRKEGRKIPTVETAAPQKPATR